MCVIIKIRHHEITRLINYETAHPSSPSINISSQACLSYQMSNLPWEHSFFWALCVDRSLKKGCWSCGGGCAAPPPQKAPFGLLSKMTQTSDFIRGKRSSTSASGAGGPSIHFLQLRERSAFLKLQRAQDRPASGHYCSLWPTRR